MKTVKELLDEAGVDINDVSDWRAIMTANVSRRKCYVCGKRKVGKLNRNKVHICDDCRIEIDKYNLGEMEDSQRRGVI